MISSTDSIQFIPLGGFGEIGMNCMAIRTGGQILIIDCGVLFPAEPRLGIDLIHASLNFLVENRHEVVGLVATHGHEDHIAAIPFLIRQIPVPIYSGKYTIGLLESRFKEFVDIKNAKFNELTTANRVPIGNFVVTPIKMPHSTVDNFALVIEVNGRRIFHTSDYKLHTNLPTRHRKLLKNLESLRPIDIMITDSTGALESTDAGDEESLVTHIGDIVETAPGRVFIALFSSNVHRICNFLQIASNTGRKLVMSGRSVLNHYSVARETGKIPTEDNIVIPVQHIGHYPDNELLILMSGTQGESRSALGRFAANRHSQFSANDTDTVILSSRFIPGNELQISTTISRLMAQNVKVFHSNNRNNVHVSGHGSRNEISTAIRVISPVAVLPAHGTYEHLQAAAEIARENGIDNTLVAVNGDIVTFRDQILVVEDHMEPGRVHIENGRAVHPDTIRERRKISSAGVHMLWVTLRACNGTEPTVHIRQQSMGVLSEPELQAAQPEVAQLVRETIKQMKGDEADTAQQIKIAVRKFFRRTFQRNPIVLIDISRSQYE